MLARTIGERLEVDGPSVAFAGVQPLLDTADVLAANLECVISKEGEPQPKAYTFRAPLVAADALATAGVDIASVANNHAMDYGWEALVDMHEHLAERQIEVVGAGRTHEEAHAPVLLEHNGLRLAFLAYVDVPVETSSGFDTRVWAATADAPGIAWADIDIISADVSAARAQADLVIVFMHFGYESSTAITAAQQAQARAAIDAGAVLVLGSHPHILQENERYRDGLIVYSLGNFIFDGFGFPENYSVIFAAHLTKEGIAEINWYPMILEDGLPRLATPEEISVGPYPALGMAGTQ
jgi:poly-gamma-glutamate capsule biosynthesis protein CapA/YwtB (metallophosphatase superfamily)